MKNLIKPFPNFASFVLTNLFLGFLVNFLLTSKYFDNTWQMIILGSIWGGSISITQWLGHAYIGVKLDEKIDILKQTKKRVIAGIVLIALYSIVAFSIVQVILIELAGGNGIEWMMHFLPNYGYIIVLISLFISFIMSSITYFKNWKSILLREQKLKEEIISYKYESLKSQLNPHFLFNSFNVLSDLIHEDQDLADKFVQKLSELYRYVLESRNKELVSIDEELKFIESYVFLLKIRFEDKLNFEINIEPDKQKQIVPMAIQILIENAVKHNEISKEKPLTIKVYQDKNDILVFNNIAKITTKVESNSIGLSNLKQQYALFSDRKMEVIETESDFMVKLPILNPESK